MGHKCMKRPLTYNQPFGTVKASSVRRFKKRPGKDLKWDHRVYILLYGANVLLHFLDKSMAFKRPASESMAQRQVISF